MTIKDLREAIKGLDDNIKIGSTGHFGELLECLSIKTETLWEGKTILCISIEDPGEEPD
jgi:hypothetical protein